MLFQFPNGCNDCPDGAELEPEPRARNSIHVSCVRQELNHLSYHSGLPVPVPAGNPELEVELGIEPRHCEMAS